MATRCVSAASVPRVGASRTHSLRAQARVKSAARVVGLGAGLRTEVPSRRVRAAPVAASGGSEVTEEDTVFMAAALDQARKGLGKTHPNPAVGCVLVKDGEVVGEGYHPKAGMPHAEVYALRAAGKEAEGATAYVTLEPCNHFGRTPPCSRALVDAKVARVVVAVVDPNPLVGGFGIKTLQDAGIEVAVGCREDEAFEINADFMARMQAEAAAKQ